MIVDVIAGRHDYLYALVIVVLLVSEHKHVLRGVIDAKEFSVWVVLDILYQPCIWRTRGVELIIVVLGAIFDGNFLLVRYAIFDAKQLRNPLDIARVVLSLSLQKAFDSEGQSEVDIVKLHFI